MTREMKAKRAKANENKVAYDRSDFLISILPLIVIVGVAALHYFGGETTAYQMFRNFTRAYWIWIVMAAIFLCVGGLIWIDLQGDSEVDCGGLISLFAVGLIGFMWLAPSMSEVFFERTLTDFECESFPHFIVALFAMIVSWRIFKLMKGRK